MLIWLSWVTDHPPARSWGPKTWISNCMSSISRVDADVNSSSCSCNNGVDVNLKLRTEHFDFYTKWLTPPGWTEDSFGLWCLCLVLINWLLMSQLSQFQFLRFWILTNCVFSEFAFALKVTYFGHILNYCDYTVLPSTLKVWLTCKCRSCSFRRRYFSNLYSFHLLAWLAPEPWGLGEPPRASHRTCLSYCIV